MRYVHGTTLRRAESIVVHGPNPKYREPGGHPTDDGFSMYRDGGPYLFQPPERYAIGKSRQFPSEGGPCLLFVEIPTVIVERAWTPWFHPEDGIVQFDAGAGLEELLAAWPSLVKEIRGVS